VGKRLGVKGQEGDGGCVRLGWGGKGGMRGIGRKGGEGPWGKLANKR